MYLFQMIDTYAVSWFAMLWIAFFEAVVIGWVYGKTTITIYLTIKAVPGTRADTLPKLSLHGSIFRFQLPVNDFKKKHLLNI